MPVAEGNIGLAFGLVVGAGLSTTVGALFVLCSSLTSKRFLAASLALSAGVMLYVSFAEIFCVKVSQAPGACKAFPCKMDAAVVLLLVVVLARNS